MQQWISVYLKDAKTRIQGYLDGYTLTLEDLFAMQTMCAYEASLFGLTREFADEYLGRLLHSDIPHSVSCSLRMSGRDSSTLGMCISGE
jgi:hypothetical protein